MSFPATESLIVIPAGGEWAECYKVGEVPPYLGNFAVVSEPLDQDKPEAVR